MKEIMNSYFITFNSGKPNWHNYSKWYITAESRSTALHKANLIHDDTYKYEVNMMTVSKEGCTELTKVMMGDANLKTAEALQRAGYFINLDSENFQEIIEILDRIWKQKLVGVWREV